MPHCEVLQRDFYHLHWLPLNQSQVNKRLTGWSLHSIRQMHGHEISMGMRRWRVLQEVAAGSSPLEVWASVAELQGRAKEAAGEEQAAAPNDALVTAALASAQPLDQHSGYVWCLPPEYNVWHGIN